MPQKQAVFVPAAMSRSQRLAQAALVHDLAASHEAAQDVRPAVFLVVAHLPVVAHMAAAHLLAPALAAHTAVAAGIVAPDQVAALAIAVVDVANTSIFLVSSTKP